jgi:biopolymer transport protein ExbB
LAARIELQILPRLRRRMASLAVIAKTEPMLGLLGTVQGMVQAFIQISGGDRDPGQLAKAIGLALVTTFIGLVVAIPVIYFLTYFRSRVQQFELDLELYVQRCLELLSR